MKMIDLESHFITQDWADALHENDGYPRLTHDEATGKWRLYYQADAFEPFGPCPGCSIWAWAASPRCRPRASTSPSSR
jgi:hypothetical protein